MAINPLQVLEMQEMEQQRTEREGFRVTDVRSADWCLRKLAAIEAKRAEYEEFVQAEIDRLQAWLKTECDSLNADEAFFTEHLTAWHAQMLEADPKNNKSLKLPHGKLKSVTRGPSVKKVNDDELLDYLKASGESGYIKIKETVDWANLKKALDDATVHRLEDGTLVVVDSNGTEVPGVVVDMGGTTFSVEVQG